MRDLICIGHLRWDFVWQRPQHVLSRLARQFRVLYVEEPITVEGSGQPLLEIFPGQKSANVSVARLVQPVQSHRWIGHGDPLTSAVYCDRLLDYLEVQGIDRPILWLYTPMASDFVDAIPHQMLVYDVMDQLAAFKGAPAELREREHDLLKQADVVFTGGVSLYRDKLTHNLNTHLFPSGVEIEHFARATTRQNFDCPPELHGVNAPILGYFGVIDERMDLQLLAHTAAAHPEWQIVMVGPVAKIDRSELPQAPNIFYVGMKGYDQLPAYLAYFDVALIPFAMNEATRFLSPTKTLEYLAAGKPIVSTPINDVIELYGDVVLVGATPDEFVAQIEAALANQMDATHLAKADDLLNQSTWDLIARNMQRVLNRTLVREELVQIKQENTKTTVQIS